MKLNTDYMAEGQMERQRATQQRGKVIGYGRECVSNETDFLQVQM
jgi:hypothetical protein